MLGYPGLSPDTALPFDSQQWSWTLPAVVGPAPLKQLELPLPIRALLVRRGFRQLEDALALLEPTALPAAEDHFPDLSKATQRLVRACNQGESLAVCGDYDADGMTSTALLLRAFTPLGAHPITTIPSRMEDGYGLNPSMVMRLHNQGIRCLVTVDNGGRGEALRCAADLGMDVIVTDHHAIPKQPAPMWALIHPATTPDQSPIAVLQV